MGPVATVLLATLLPTLLLIVALSFLSIHLYVKLKASRAKHQAQPTKDTTAPEPTQDPVQDSAKDPLAAFRYPNPIPPRMPLTSLSDVSNINWAADFYHLSSCITDWPLMKEENDLPTESRLEVLVESGLKALGYQGAPFPVILKLLRNGRSRYAAVEHITLTVALARTSLGSELGSTLLPFPLEVCQDLCSTYKALEGVKRK